MRISDWSADVCSSDVLAVDERRQSEQHADAGRTKAVTPAEGFAEPRAQHAGDHAAEIDAGVVDREARFAARIVIGVQPANQCRDIGLQKAEADEDRKSTRLNSSH